MKTERQVGGEQIHSPESLHVEERDVEHHCGLVGFYFFEPSKDLSRPIQSLSLLQHRGQKGSGVVTMLEGGEMDFWETDARLSVATHNDEYKAFACNSEQKGVRMVVGHNRYETSGCDAARQPIIEEELITAHNGNLTNPRILNSYFDSEQAMLSDTYALHHAIKNAEGESLDEKIANTLPHVEGAYSLVLVDPQSEALYGVVDPQNYRPLSIGTLKDGSGYAFASETVSLKEIADTIYEVQPGEGWKVQDGRLEQFYQDPRERRRQSCIFEMIYFARPESNLFGMNAGEFRRLCGEAIATEDFQDGFVPEVVVPVRNSGTIGCEGYSKGMIQEQIKELIETVRETGEEVDSSSISDSILKSGLNTNEYGRVFIESNDRVKKASDKFSVDPAVVCDKSVALIDDSVVRGDTLSAIVEKLREAGAREVHVRSVSPKIISECYYGIDFPTKEELIASGRNEEEIADILHVDSIKYLSVEKMSDIAEELSGHAGYCTSCFTGNYPYPVNRDELILKEG